MKKEKSKGLFSQLYKKAILYDLVDEGGWFPQMLVSRKTTAEYTKLAKTSLCPLCALWLKISLCLSAFVAENISIKNNKLCKTNPIQDKVKFL